MDLPALGPRAVLAGIGLAEATFIGVMSMTLNGAACALPITVALTAVEIVRSHLLPSWAATLPTPLARLTFLTLAAIMASGSRAQAGLMFAVVVVTTAGGARVPLGRALWRYPLSAATNRDSAALAAAACARQSARD